jgi:hypothetical protein
MIDVNQIMSTTPLYGLSVVDWVRSPIWSNHKQWKWHLVFSTKHTIKIDWLEGMCPGGITCWLLFQWVNNKIELITLFHLSSVQCYCNEQYNIYIYSEKMTEKIIQSRIWCWSNIKRTLSSSKTSLRSPWYSFKMLTWCPPRCTFGNEPLYIWRSIHRGQHRF